MSNCTATFRIDQNAPMLHCARVSWRLRIVRRTPLSDGQRQSRLTPMRLRGFGTSRGLETALEKRESG